MSGVNQLNCEILALEIVMRQIDGIQPLTLEWSDGLKAALFPCSLPQRTERELESQVEHVNSEFYRILESGSIEEMDGVWLQEDWVKPVHPGWGVISGWRHVRESLKAILEDPRDMRMIPTEIWTRVSGDVAWLVCTENLTLYYEESFESSQAIATNLFFRKDDHWYMVYHHASTMPVILSDASISTIQ